MVERNASISETVEAMKARRLGCALVCERGELVGLFTERDLLNKVIGEPVSYSTAVEHVMTANPARLSIDDSVFAAMRLMREGDYRNVPLVDGPVELLLAWDPAATEVRDGAVRMPGGSAVVLHLT